jgi:hypothetical protein
MRLMKHINVCYHPLVQAKISRDHSRIGMYNRIYQPNLINKKLC